MNILTLDHISKSYTGRLLFDEASFYLSEGEKVGIIGINGTGKSTLLRIIAGEEEPDSGKVIRANNITVQMLVQHPTFNPEDTVLEAVLRSYVKTVRTQAEYDKDTENESMDYEYIKQDWQEAEKVAQAKAMLMQLDITDFDKKAELLSGGQKKRVALVSVLLHKSDILLLDEPTNHLDAKMSQWLEDFLKSYRGTLVMITHDRYFLDSVTNRIVEIDRGSIYSYDENYSGFLKRKAEREDSLQSSDRKRRAILKNELAWVMRGARARTTKQKARLERFEELKQTKLLAEDGDVQLSSITSRMGKTTIELHNLSKSYDGKCLFSDFSYTFLKQDRIGFVGENGAGKTTLMRMIATAAGQFDTNEQSVQNEMSKDEASRDSSVYPDSGSITIGQTIKVGYYSQEIATDVAAGKGYMNPDERVIDFVKETAEFVPTTEGLISAAKMCERFLFDSEMQYGLIGKLSGGQKRRLHLLKILMEAPNVLILDEPTNDLDIRTLMILEDYLDQFDGIVMIVSHDRYFLDRIVRRIFAFEDGKICQYEGGYTDYQLRQIIKEKQSEKRVQSNNRTEKNRTQNTPSETRGKPQSEKSRKLKFTFKEQKEYETIEGDIEVLEEKLQKLEKSMTEAARDFVKLNELSKEKEDLENLLSEKMDRWVYLEELAARIEEEKK